MSKEGFIRVLKWVNDALITAAHRREQLGDAVMGVLEDKGVVQRIAQMNKNLRGIPLILGDIFVTFHRSKEWAGYLTTEEEWFRALQKRVKKILSSWKGDDERELVRLIVEELDGTDLSSPDQAVIAQGIKRVFLDWLETKGTSPTPPPGGPTPAPGSILERFRSGFNATRRP